MIVIVVFVVAVVVGLALVGARRFVFHGEPLDVEHQERWLVRHSPAWLATPLRTLDRRFVGGIAVGASFIAVFAAAVVVGWIFSGIDDQRGIAQWDMSAAEYGRDHATAGSTRVLQWLTDLGGTWYLLVLMGGVGLFHLAKRRNWGPLAYLAVVGIGISLLNNGLKLLVDRERPQLGQLAGSAGSSFPSGHSAAAAACWAAIALVVVRRRSSRTRWVATSVSVVIALVVATTRVLLGVHWLSDVVAGVIVGWTWFLVVTIAFGGRLLALGEPAARMVEEADRNESIATATGDPS